MTPYDEALASFDPAQAWEVLSGRPDAVNACIECCDRHASGNGVALRWVGETGEEQSWTFAALRDDAARFAGLLAEAGVQPGDRVAGLLPRIPELLITILGTWRAGAVYQPLFTAFGPKAIAHRLSVSGARLIVTDTVNRPKLDDIDGCPATLVVGAAAGRLPDCDFAAELARFPTIHTPVMRTADDPFLMMFTSGTTGPAKAVAVPIRALVAFVGYMRDAVGLRMADRFWNIADPGWAYGLYYAVAGPLAMGCATTLHAGPFTAESTYRVMRSLRITNLAGAPTAFRLLLAAGVEAAREVKGQLRVVSSAGEPLNAEVIRWFREHLDVTVHDHYGQTELGMVLCNHHALDHPVHERSAGLAVLGHRLAVVDDELHELPPGHSGTLAVDRTKSPLLWFAGYHEQSTPAFRGDYYLTGDTVERGADGAISFVGRADDVITSSGYRIGPFEVESALLEHDAVVESAVIGKPDPSRTEIVKAFVVLAPGVVPGNTLVHELQQHVRERLSAHAYPREVVFVADLPKTPSGKLQRFMLRQAERADKAG
jgi:acetyl-CoA synthetase